MRHIDSLPLLMLATALNAHGQTFSGSSTGYVAIDTFGTYFADRIIVAEPTEFHTIAAIPDPNTIDYDYLEYDTDSFQFQLTDTFSPGLGSPVSITTTVTFDPIFLSATGPGPLGLTPRPGGTLDVEDYRGQNTTPVFSDFIATGTWTIEGPTETASGSFSISYVQSDINSRIPDFVVDGSHFPASFELLQTANSSVGYGKDVIQRDFGAVVDGIFIEMHLIGIRFGADDTLMTIPGDLDIDGFVGVADLNIVLAHWNSDASTDPRSDPTGDGFVGIDDLNIVLGNWNTGTPPTANTQIPEPGTAAAFTIGSLLSIRQRTRD